MNDIVDNKLDTEATLMGNAKKKKDRRWDKKLAAQYGIPKAFRSYARRYGSSTEMMLSTMLQVGAINYKEPPK
jgi:hypothetical protein